MTPHPQKFRHAPEHGVWGDCWRACIASLLDLPLEEVPHVLDQGVEIDVGRPALHAWLKPRGLSTFMFPMSGSLQEVLTAIGEWNPDAFYMLVGKSRTGCNHIVICRGNEIIHDTGITQPGIIGPCIEDDTYFWIEVLVHDGGKAF